MMLKSSAAAGVDYVIKTSPEQNGATGVPLNAARWTTVTPGSPWFAPRLPRLFFFYFYFYFFNKMQADSLKYPGLDNLTESPLAHCPPQNQQLPYNSEVLSQHPQAAPPRLGSCCLVPTRILEDFPNGQFLRPQNYPSIAREDSKHPIAQSRP